MKKSALIGSVVLAIILLGVGGYFAFNKYQEAKKAEEERKYIAETLQQVEPLVKNTNIRVQTCLKVEAEDLKITWADYFDLLKRNTDELQENILKGKTIETEKNKSIISKSLRFIEQSQALLRIAQMEVRNRFEVSTSKKRVAEKESEYLNKRNSMSSDLYYKWWLNARDEYEKVMAKYNESKAELLKALKATKLSAKTLDFDCKETILLINQRILVYDYAELNEEEIKEIFPETNPSRLKELFPGLGAKASLDVSKSYGILSPDKCAEVMKTDVSTINEMGKFISVFSKPDGQTKVAGIAPGVKVIIKDQISSYCQIEGEDGTKGWIMSNWIDEIK
jgi:hypothetical protein